MIKQAAEGDLAGLALARQHLGSLAAYSRIQDQNQDTERTADDSHRLPGSARATDLLTSVSSK
jgi:hypothetical protein